MKKIFGINLFIVLISFSSSILFFSCKGNNKQEDKSTDKVTLKENNEDVDIDIKTKKIKEVFHLDNNKTSPTCELDINYAYLQETGMSNIVCRKINNTIAENVLGDGFSNVIAPLVVDSFKNNYLTNYENDIEPLYKEDLKNKDNKDDVSQWYDYSYKLKSTINTNNKSVINYKANITEYTGGAHDNIWSRWMNFDRKTGELITLKRVFIANSNKSITELLLKELMKTMSKKHHTDINSTNELQEIGILDNVQMFIPDNFILGDDEISFLYNCYDIAPFSEGNIVLSLPYSDIEKYMYK